jgi:hypothetical protein
MRRTFAATAAAIAVAALAPAAGASVLRVGTYHGIAGQYTTIQAAVNAAKPGDWILIGPGDYKTTSIEHPSGGPQFPAGVLITTPNLYVRGMNRNTVVVDGTKPGSSRCSSQGSAQNFGLSTRKGPTGLNGIMVWKADNVWVQNLTACNFLGGSGGDGQTGNEIWWNGGAGSGKIGGHGMVGSYLNTTSTFYKTEASAAQYGIFSSNWTGGTWDQSYASNFNDSGYYIGACQQQCDQTINHARGEFNALGYSGSNSGGQLVIKNSEFDNNEDGFDTNSQNGDNPPPQDGACPNGGTSPITHTHSCWVFMDNYVHDNNNPNVPSAGAAAAGPVGTGMTVAGGRNDTIIHNRFANNDAWGVAFTPWTSTGKPCTGGTLGSPLVGKGTCLFDEYGDALIDNAFVHNGGYGNPTNGDFDQFNFETHATDCYSGNTDAAGALTADAAMLESTYPACTGASVPLNFNRPFLNEVLCDSQVKLPPFGCQRGDSYPRRTRVIMHPLPANLPTMPNPCAGVPANPWCTAGKRSDYTSY